MAVDVSPGIRELLGSDCYPAILEAVSEGVYVVDRQRRIVYWNSGAESLTGYGREEVLSARCQDTLIRHVDASGRQLCSQGCPLQATLEDGEPREGELFLSHSEGYRMPVRARTHPLRSPDGEIIGAVETFTSIAENLAALEQVGRLEKLAYIDPLTEVGNRRLLEQTLAARRDEMTRYSRPCGLVLMDIDHFKAINDALGHTVGDRVLRVVAQTLRGVTRSFDLVGRWGGEEFLAILTITSANELGGIAERYRALVERSELLLPGQRVRVTISAGAALFRPGEDAAAAIARADDLLYESKRGGRNRVTVEGIGSQI